MKRAITSPIKKQPLKQKYLDVFTIPPCELWRTPEQHEISVLNLVQNNGAPYVWLPDNYFAQAVKPESKIAKYWKAVIRTVLFTPKNIIKKYAGWKKQQADLAKLMQEVKL